MRGIVCVNPGARPTSPQPVLRERLNLRIGRYQRETFDLRLRCKQPVERIAMRRSQQSGRADVSDGDREQTELQAHKVDLDVVKNMFSSRPLTKSNFDCDFPYRSATDLNLCGGRFNRSAPLT